MNIIKRFIYILAVIMASVVPLVFTQPAYAGTTTFASSACPSGSSAAKCSACQGLSVLGSGQSCSSKGSTLNGVIAIIMDLLSYVLGILAVIMIIISGIRFVTAGGNSSSVDGAKKTLIYALIGIVVASLAQVIVHWVLNSASTI